MPVRDAFYREGRCLVRKIEDVGGVWERVEDYINTGWFIKEDEGVG